MIIVWADNSLWWNWLSSGKKKKAWFVVFANVYGTNTSIMDTVKVPTGSHRMLTWEEMWGISYGKQSKPVPGHVWLSDNTFQKS